MNDQRLIDTINGMKDSITVLKEKFEILIDILTELKLDQDENKKS